MRGPVPDPLSVGIVITSQPEVIVKAGVPGQGRVWLYTQKIQPGPGANPEPGYLAVGYRAVQQALFSAEHPNRKSHLLTDG